MKEKLVAKYYFSAYLVGVGSGVRTRGFGGQNPPLTLEKKKKTLLLGTIRFFDVEIAEIAIDYHVFQCSPTCLCNL